MIDASALTKEQTDQLEFLRTADRRTLKVLFRSLSAPCVRELDGEYDAELLAQGGVGIGWAVQSAFALYGEWLGKAFHPQSEEAGTGYNYFRSKLDASKAVQRLPMDIYLADSCMADGPCMRIDYQRRSRGLVRLLEGEVRQVRPGVLLGFGSLGFKLGRRDRWRRRIPFVMVGPMRPFQDKPDAASYEGIERKVA